MARKRMAAVLCGLLAAVMVFPSVASAKITYMPDVTEAMTKSNYWAEKFADPDAVLADYDQILKINEVIRSEESTNVSDLAAKYNDGDTFDGVAAIESTKKAYLDDEIPYLYNVGARYGNDGTKYASLEEAKEKKYLPLLDNMDDPNATTSMPYQFAICTTRTTLNNFPSEEQLRDDFSDPDFDYEPIAALRVNEPVVLKTKSKDGLYYYAIANAVSGWVRADCVAICADKSEWLDAWYSEDPSDFLVVCADRILTDESNYAPEVSKRELTLGTTLKIADQSDWTERIINRSPQNNSVVWMPVRNEDGSYTKELALIAEHHFNNGNVNEGYLPLTGRNLMRVSLSHLGTIYGWSGMLGSNDCSGFVRDVYHCFGFELARNTTWQMNEPVKRYDLSEMSSEDKSALIKTLPPGTVLFFRGHEMIYLGYEGDLLYVMSSVSSVMMDGKRVRVRSGVINTLDMYRTNGNTWLEDLIVANIPYLTSEQDLPALAEDVEPPVAEPGEIHTETKTNGISGEAFNLDELADEILTDEEKAAIENGDSIDIWMEMEAIAKAVVANEDAAALDAYLSAQGLTAGEYLDISLLKQVGDSEPESIHETPVPIEFAVSIPESLMNTDEDVTRTFYLLRVHEGQVDEITTGKSDVLDGESTLFSTYLVAYKDATSADATPSGSGSGSESGDSSSGGTSSDQSKSGTVKDNSADQNNGSAYTQGDSASKNGTTNASAKEPVKGGDTGDSNQIFVFGGVCVATIAAFAVFTGMGRRRKHLS